ncbi:hypothetical protein [Actinocorallia populi]|uniref:hypothetical protein n=1 Tax=Actinocorallia populi TaxID=2079200 RepID=UPI001300B213|nr:hypothetical protein [Actinocorallia populi]
MYQPDDLRVCLTADMLRRVALRLRRRALTTAAHAADHGWLSIPRLEAGDPLPGALGVGKLTSGASVGVAEWTAPPPADVEPAALRLALLRHRYREEARLGPEAVSAASADLARWRGRLAEWATLPSEPIHAPYAAQTLEALCDDLDVPRALDVLDGLMDDEGVAPGARLETVLQLDQILALELPAAIGTR